VTGCVTPPTALESHMRHLLHTPYPYFHNIPLGGALALLAVYLDLLPKHAREAACTARWRVFVSATAGEPSVTTTA
jgi:hypothetical protein